MKTLRAIMMFGLLLTTPVVAAADDVHDAPAADAAMKDARLVPVLRDGTFVGLKVYAIRAGGRFDRVGFRNGDTIEAVDNEPVTSEAGTRALHDKVVLGKADAQITLRHEGKVLTITSKANP